MLWPGAPDLEIYGTIVPAKAFNGFHADMGRQIGVTYALREPAARAREALRGGHGAVVDVEIQRDAAWRALARSACLPCSQGTISRMSCW